MEELKNENLKSKLEKILSDETLFKNFSEKFETEINSFLENSKQTIENTAVEEKTEVEEKTTEVVENKTEVVEEKISEEVPKTATVQPIEVRQTDRRLGIDNPPDKEKAKNDALALEIKNLQITFSNGKVKHPYEQDFDLDKYKFHNNSIASVEFVGLDAIGLQYFPEEKKIKGTPTQAGDHKITMKFKIKGDEIARPSIEREVVFIINPDPRDLWSKNIPTPEDIEYYKPDSAKDFVKVESKKTKGVLGIGKKEIARKDMVAASQRGRSHAIEGKPRDDDFSLYFDEVTEWYIMVVADGAGSAKYSRRGSQIACQKVMDICKEKLLENKDVFLKKNKLENKNEIGKILQETISNAVFDAYKAIENEAQEKNYLIKDFATTLLLSICKKFEYGWFVAAWWVGDGGIGIYRKELQELKVLGEADGGEFAGQTRFLTMPDIIKNELYSRMKFEIIEDFTAVILMTDGVTDPKFETDANLNRIEKWNELWNDLNGNNEDNLKVDFSDNNEQAADQLLNWLNFWSKGNHDDRTIAILF